MCSCVGYKGPAIQLRMPTHHWPSINLVNQYTEFPVYLLEVNTKKDGLFNHHELFVDLSAVYGLPPVDFNARTPNGKHIPVCGAVLYMGADTDHSTSFRMEYYTSNDGPRPMPACTLHLQVN